VVCDNNWLPKPFLLSSMLSMLHAFHVVGKLNLYLFCKKLQLYHCLVMDKYQKFDIQGYQCEGRIVPSY